MSTGRTAESGPSTLTEVLSRRRSLKRIKRTCDKPDRKGFVESPRNTTKVLVQVCDSNRQVEEDGTGIGGKRQ